MTDPKKDDPKGTVETEITIQPDGRVYVHGTSREVLEALASLERQEGQVHRILSQAKTQKDPRTQ